MIQLLSGDCLERMRELADNSVDMVLADLPYGITACKWDTVIPFEPLWAELNRICKLNAAMCLFGSEPFSSALRLSNKKNYRYDWIWQKGLSTGFLDARRKPMKIHETISIFSRKRTLYNPQMREGKPYVVKRGQSGASITADVNIQKAGYVTINKGERFPVSVIKFNTERGEHTTQKPVPLLEYLIKTYTVEGETVLDPTMGSGSTGVACLNTGRKFIGIEREPEYLKITQARISEAIK